MAGFLFLWPGLKANPYPRQSNDLNVLPVAGIVEAVLAAAFHLILVGNGSSPEHTWVPM